MIYICTSGVSHHFLSCIENSALDVTQSFNPLFLFSQVLGALWYLLSVDRQTACWKKNCRDEIGCAIKFLDCDDTPNTTWANTTTIFRNCNASNGTIDFDFGMFLPALTNQAPAESFVMKYFYSLWWGLQNLRYFLFPKHTFSCHSQLEFLMETYFTFPLHKPVISSCLIPLYGRVGDLSKKNLLSFV
jgi:hypothetical protein